MTENWVVHEVNRVLSSMDLKTQYEDVYRYRVKISQETQAFINK